MNVRTPFIEMAERDSMMDSILDLQGEKSQFLIYFADFLEIWRSSRVSEKWLWKELMIQWCRSTNCNNIIMEETKTVEEFHSKIQLNVAPDENDYKSFIIH